MERNRSQFQEEVTHILSFQRLLGKAKSGLPVSSWLERGEQEWALGPQAVLADGARELEPMHRVGLGKGTRLRREGAEGITEVWRAGASSLWNPPPPADLCLPQGPLLHLALQG